ncbi:hypothetical protein IAR50_000009 [Cryptococcus sp. DSM 104548]
MSCSWYIPHIPPAFLGGRFDLPLQNAPSHTTDQLNSNPTKDDNSDTDDSLLAQYKATHSRPPYLTLTLTLPNMPRPPQQPSHTGSHNASSTPFTLKSSYKPTLPETLRHCYYESHRNEEDLFTKRSKEMVPVMNTEVLPSTTVWLDGRSLPFGGLTVCRGPFTEPFVGADLG